MHIFKKAICGLLFIGASLVANPSEREIASSFNKFTDLVTQGMNEPAEHDLVQLKQYLDHEFSTFKAQCTYAMQHYASNQERAAFIRMLHVFKKLTVVLDN